MNYFIFDIDGTLIDSAHVDQIAFQQALRAQGQDYTLEELRWSFGMPGRDALRKLGIADIEGTVTHWETLAYANLDQIKPYDGVLEVLTTLREQGCKLGVVTSRTRKQLEGGVTPLGLNGYFDEIICADDVAMPKPAPDGLLECLRRLGGTQTEAVYIGDSRYDMQCAAAAGVKSVLALWGCHEPDSLTADLRLETPAEILTLKS
ncbi:HAD family hydrolase [Butyricicoccus sp. Marseille-Q5471]|uniref:HAD family hydrolase n=1 Tax=Butyricicoccus sp. Marseille-Q5471 TaxID=3039493 RepID=UPI0024BBFD60|nr:HAD family hydrolase [Butyricicoccus sp. Marseille-Q5471]